MLRVTMNECSLANQIFLDAFSNLYKRVCPSVGPSVTLELKPCKSAILTKTTISTSENASYGRVSGLVVNKNGLYFNANGWVLFGWKLLKNFCIAHQS